MATQYKQIFTSSSNGMTYSIDFNSLPKTPAELKSLRIVSFDENDRVVLSLGDHPAATRAEQVLLDKVTLSLLTTLGSNDFDPQMGSFLTLLQRGDSSNPTVLRTKIALALQTIKTKIKADQETQTGLGSAQKLQDLLLNNIYLDPLDSTNLLIEILVVTAANEEYIITV